MSLYKSYTLTEEAKTIGVLFDYGDHRIRCKHAGRQNEDYQEALRLKMKPYNKAIAKAMQSGRDTSSILPDKKMESILIDLYANHLVTEFYVRNKSGEMVRGVELPSGDIVEDTPENIKMLFTNLPDIFYNIRDDAADLNYFTDLSDIAPSEEEAGN